MSPRLTVNYGLRWEPFFPLHLTRRRGLRVRHRSVPAGGQEHDDAERARGSVLPWRSGLSRGRGGLQTVEAIRSARRVRVGPERRRPYVGARLLRHRLRLRRGAEPGRQRQRAAARVPQSSCPSPAGGLDNPWLGIAGGNPFPYVSSPTSAVFDQFGNFLPVAEYDMRPPEVHSWNLSVQRQFGTDLMVSATYLGNQATHLWVQRPANPAVYIPGGPCTIAGVTYNPCSTTANTNQRRALHLENPREGQFYGILDAQEDGGTSNYHGLLLSAQRRAARGLTLGSNYTWSHCISDNTSLGNKREHQRCLCRSEQPRVRPRQLRVGPASQPERDRGRRNADVCAARRCARSRADGVWPGSIAIRPAAT